MEKYTIDTAASRLEEIIDNLESESCDLETAIKLYEEGVRLVSYCNKTLINAKQTIINLSETSESYDMSEEDEEE